MSYLWRIKNFYSKTVNFFCFRDLTMEAKIFRTDRYIFCFRWATYERTKNSCRRHYTKHPFFLGIVKGCFGAGNWKIKKFSKKTLYKTASFSPYYEEPRTADISFTERRCSYGEDQKSYWPWGGINLYSFLNAQRAWGRVCKFAKVLEGIAYFF